MAASEAPSKDPIQGANILVIGGSSGIGYAVAAAALDHGAALVTLASSRQPKIDDAAARLRARHPDRGADAVRGFACDLSDAATLEQSLTALLEAATDGGARKLDHIVVTAGEISGSTALAELTVDKALAPATMRIVAPFLLGKLAPRYLAPGPAASITLTGGGLGRRPLKGMTVLGVYATAAETTAVALATELAPVRVNAITPGAIATEGTRAAIPDEAFAAIGAQGLTGHVGAPAEMAEAYLFCMRCTFVTAAILDVDGGVLHSARGMPGA